MYFGFLHRYYFSYLVLSELFGLFRRVVIQTQWRHKKIVRFKIKTYKYKTVSFGEKILGYIGLCIVELLCLAVVMFVFTACGTDLSESHPEVFLVTILVFNFILMWAVDLISKEYESIIKE